jgi:hypothetical protein
MPAVFLYINPVLQLLICALTRRERAAANQPAAFGPIRAALECARARLYYDLANFVQGKAVL